MKLSKWFAKKSSTKSSQSPFSSQKLKEILFESFKEIRTPNFEKGIESSVSVEISSTEPLVIKLTTGVRLEPFKKELTEALNQRLTDQLGVTANFDFEFELQTVKPSQPQQARFVVAVSSGKGGVGKSTVTANLAVSLAQQGYKVGVLDADIYGPSMPMMFGLQGQNVVTHDEKTMEPFYQHGVYLNSIGFLIPADKATIWRGPMASRALMQVINETNWPQLDVLLVDMPPGTGDIQLTMSETVKCHGAVIVTTPQNVALADAEKGIEMFKKVATPVLGVIENMSQFVCTECGHAHTLFGSGGGLDCASKHDVPLLAQLPLISAVRSHADDGVPYALATAQGSTKSDELAQMSTNDTNNQYQKLALSLMMQLSKSTPQTISIM